MIEKSRPALFLVAQTASNRASGFGSARVVRIAHHGELDGSGGPVLSRGASAKHDEEKLATAVVPFPSSSNSEVAVCVQECGPTDR
jgi:hypothetical protein